MRADVLQVVALCCHSHSFLSGQTDAPLEMLANSTFLPVNEVSFGRMGTRRLIGGIIADATGPWLRRLSKEGVDRLTVSLSGCPFDPVHESSEPWGILSDGDAGFEIWQPDWKKRVRSYGDLSPWHVTYTSARANRWNVAREIGPAESQKLLMTAIREAAADHPLIEELSTEPYHNSDLFPEDWPTEQTQLGNLAARTAALMRSDEWAEVAHSRQIDLSEYSAISQKLWKAALIALESAARLESTALRGSAMIGEEALAHPSAQNYRLAG